MNWLAMAAILSAFGGLGKPNLEKKGSIVIKFFNSFQLVSLFAAGPFIIQWLHTATFTGATAAFWVALAAYLVEFVWLIGCVHDDV